MTTLLEQIETMRVHVNDLLSAERGLIKTVADELQRADQELLKAIRNVAAEHAMRRGVILAELQSLAERVGLLSTPSNPLANRESAYGNSLRSDAQHDDRHTMREHLQFAATSFEEEVHYHLNGRMH